MMNNELNALAEILTFAGWTSPNDAQWTRLDAAIPTIRNLLSRPAPAPVAVPEGFVLVPVVPSSDMVMNASLYAEVDPLDCRSIYRAMLAATPSAPATVASEADALRAQLAERERAFNRLEQETLERAEAVIMQAANCRALADALKVLTQAARISGGVAGADSNLMAACEKAENALSLVGIGQAVNAVLDVLDEQGRLRKQIDEANEKLAASEARVLYARDLLIGAVNDIENWAAYASEYFQRKHKLNDSLAEYRGAIAGLAALPSPPAIASQEVGHGR